MKRVCWMLGRAPRRRCFPLVALLAAVAFLGAGCDSGSVDLGSSVTPLSTGNNFQTEDVRVQTAAPQAGHPMTLEVEVTAEQDAEQIPLAFYLLDKEDFDGDAAEIKQYFAGEMLLATAAAGSHAYTVTVAVPGEVPAGDYYLITLADPSGLHEELDENDNFPDPEATALADISATVHISRDHAETPNLMIEDVSFDSDVILFEADDYEDNGLVHQIEDMPDLQIGATVKIRSVGVLPVTEVPLTLCVNTWFGCEPLEIWDSANLELTQTLVLDQLEPNEVNIVHLGARISQQTWQNIWDYVYQMGEDTFDLEIALDGADLIAEFEDAGGALGNDNLLVRQLRLVPPEEYPYNPYDPYDPYNPYEPYEPGLLALGAAGAQAAYATPLAVDPNNGLLQYSDDYGKTLASDYFSAGVEFSALARLDNGGALGHVQGSVPLKVFGHTFDFAYINVMGQAVPHRVQDSGFDLDVRFAGNTLYSRSGDAGFSWDNDWNVTKSKGYTTRFWLGIVPMALTASASGSLGFGIEAEIADDFVTNAGPYVDVGSNVTAGIDLLIASGGVTADMSLIKDTFKGDASASMTLADGGATLNGTLAEQISNQLQGPQGKVSLFVSYPDGVRWCKSWGVPYPCGVRTAYKSQTLVNWQSYSRNDVLLSKQQSTSVSLNQL
ncbi:hypothetical protein DESUT3_27170 [Desulfuromonas versatilis]|uniref:CARDB domain-containing protein n=1 Tax=Desulfuromonas versatilis TaxID=2802975 RepID=A0ABM8HY52_9BACT|nr:hypothetical protein [Desulfuromonas versatilis]BCR05648.1 hypothetical protein DESUT3_27170 [Desulfuromonas versatilis]